MHKDGMSVPAWDRRVVVQPILVPIWNAWAEMDRTRLQTGMAPPAPISEMQIESWLSIHSVTDASAKVWFYDLINALDKERTKDWYKPKEEDDDNGGGTDQGDKDAHDAHGRS